MNKLKRRSLRPSEGVTSISTTILALLMLPFYLTVYAIVLALWIVATLFLITYRFWLVVWTKLKTRGERLIKR